VVIHCSLYPRLHNKEVVSKAVAKQQSRGSQPVAAMRQVATEKGGQGAASQEAARRLQAKTQPGGSQPNSFILLKGRH